MAVVFLEVTKVEETNDPINNSYKIYEEKIDQTICTNCVYWWNVYGYQQEEEKENPFNNHFFTNFTFQET